MNVLLFSEADRRGEGHIRIGGERLTHLRTVNDLSVGQVLRVGAIDGLLGSGRVAELSADCADLAITLSEPPPAKLPTKLVLALPRPKMLRRILRSVAEFGVPELHLVNSYRVEKSYWQTPVLAPDTVREYLLQGLAQSVDTVLPAVHRHERFKPFVEDYLPSLLEGHTGLLAHPGAANACPADAPAASVLVIGPEGGFTDYEVDKLREAGCLGVHLGPRILRVENAVSRLLGKLY